MLRIFVILVFCGVVFGGIGGPSQTATVLVASSPTVAPKMNSTTSVTSKTMATASATTRAANMTIVVSSTSSSTKTSAAMLNSTTKPKPTISPNATIGPKPTATPTPQPTSKPVTPTTQYPGGNFSLKEDGKFCLLAEFAATFTIEYRTKNDTKPEIVLGYLNRTDRSDVDVTGDCGINATTSNLRLSWPIQTKFYQLTMEFEKTGAANSNTSANWEWSMVTFNVTVEGNKAFKNFSKYPYVRSKSNKTSTTFNSKLGSYYKCDAISPVVLENGFGDKFNVKLFFRDLKLEPFAQSKDGRFNGTHDDCPADSPSTPPPKPKPTKSKSNDIVPIAVGCALAGLVLIVLIAYVIGRRKSHSGYEKV